MTRELFAEDAYLAEFPARVARNSGREVVLDRTAFYPGGSGQPPDKGELSVGPISAKVIEVRRAEPDFDDEDLEDEEGPAVSGEVVHVLDRAIPRTVREVRAALDWPRRHRNMRYNTALALLSATASRDLGAVTNVGRIRSSRARLDLADPSNAVSDETVRGMEKSVNEAVSAGRSVEVYGDVFEVSGLPKTTASGLYVRDTSEVGRLEITRYFDRGARGVRLEFTLGEKTEGEGI